MNQRERTRTLQDMRRGRVRTLVATDVAARGLDVAGHQPRDQLRPAAAGRGLRAPDRPHRPRRRDGDRGVARAITATAARCARSSVTPGRRSPRTSFPGWSRARVPRVGPSLDAQRRGSPSIAERRALAPATRRPGRCATAFPASVVPANTRRLQSEGVGALHQSHLRWRIRAAGPPQGAKCSLGGQRSGVSRKRGGPYLRRRAAPRREALPLGGQRSGVSRKRGSPYSRAASRLRYAECRGRVILRS